MISDVALIDDAHQRNVVSQIALYTGRVGRRVDWLMYVGIHWDNPPVVAVILVVLDSTDFGILKYG